MTCDTNFPTNATPSDDTDTPSPTRSPTPSPSDTDSNEMSGVSITVTNKVGSNAYWYAVVLTVGSVAVGEVDGLSVSSVEMLCSSCDEWETGVAQWDYYKFDANPPYDAPFEIRVTANGEASTSTISSPDEGAAATTTF